jgi:glycosyltransferase involved in cell wall biosynthesis
MRITCVIGPYLPVPPLRGGAVERIWQGLCREFARMGHDVTLISRQFDDLPSEETIDGVRYLRVLSRDAPQSKLLYRLFDVAYALRVCVELPPSDVTITNSVSLPLLIPRGRAGKIYVSVARFPKGQMWLYRRADRLQAVSKSVAQAIQTELPTDRRVKVLPNALSATFSDLRQASRGPRRKEILYVGRLAREKGLDLLIRAFAQIEDQDDWQLTLLGPSEVAEGGDGPDYYKELESISRLAQGRVKLELPLFDEPALIARLKSVEIFAYPSVAEAGESFGMAPLEAMACGCAVVVSSLACFEEFVVHGSNALVFDHRDGDVALASALKNLIQSAELRAALGEAAIRTSKYFDAVNVAKQFATDFIELAGDQGKRT